MSITTKALTATVNATKVYGTSDPALGTVPVVLGGLVNTTVTDWNAVSTPINDSALTSSATALTRTGGETVASYAILTGSFTTPSAKYSAPGQGGGSDLTITTKALTATVNATKVYGTSDPALGTVPVVLGGLVNTTVTDWNAVSTPINDSALTSSATALTLTGGETVASYAILTGSFTTPSANYSAPTLGGGSDLTITTKALTATSNATKADRTRHPALRTLPVVLRRLVNTTVSPYTPLFRSINDSALTSSATALTRTGGETVASYAILTGSFTTPSANYSAPTLGGGSDLTITTKALTA